MTMNRIVCGGATPSIPNLASLTSPVANLAAPDPAAVQRFESAMAPEPVETHESDAARTERLAREAKEAKEEEAEGLDALGETWSPVTDEQIATLAPSEVGRLKAFWGEDDARFRLAARAMIEIRDTIADDVVREGMRRAKRHSRD